MEIVVLLWLVCGVAAAVIAAGRGANGCLWFGLGILCGPIGLALAFSAGGDQKKCPFCQSSIHGQAVRCPKCQANLAPASAAAHGGALAAGPGLPRARPEEQMALPVLCPSCGAEVPPHYTFCGVCGTRVSRAILYCTKCGAEVPAGNSFCGSCGTQVETELPSAVPVPAKSQPAKTVTEGPIHEQAGAFASRGSADEGVRRIDGKPWRIIAGAILLCALVIWLVVIWQGGHSSLDGLDGEEVLGQARQIDIYNAAQAEMLVDHPDFHAEQFSGPLGSIVREKEAPVGRLLGKPSLYTVRLHYRDGAKDRIFICTMTERDAELKKRESGRWSVSCREK